MKNIRLSVDDGVATLHGVVESGVDKSIVGSATAKHEGVENVNNYLQIEN